MRCEPFRVQLLCGIYNGDKGGYSHCDVLFLAIQIRLGDGSVKRNLLLLLFKYSEKLDSSLNLTGIQTPEQILKLSIQLYFYHCTPPTSIFL